MIIFCILLLTVFCLVVKNEKRTQIFEKYEKVILVSLFVIGILVRFLYFWKFPAGFNQDEASIGYDVFADLNYGFDRNGYHNPVYSVAWGSGHSGLYMLLLRPFIRLFGLSIFSVRIVNVIFGCIGLFAFYGILKKLRGKEFALLGLFFMMINPWHIMMSRWGLECNLFPNIFLIAFYFFVKGQEKSYFYYLAAFFFSLSLYAYGTSYMFIPVFLLIAVIYLLRKKAISVKEILISGSIFTLVAIPILIFMAVNFLGLPEQNWGFLSFPKLIDGRYNTTVTVLGGNFLQRVLTNLKTFGKILIFQNDGLPWNAISGYGVFYFFSLPFAILGIFALLKDPKNQGRILLYSMLPASLVLASLSDLNINRANIIFVLLIYLVVEGIYFIKVWTGKPFYLLLGVYSISFCLFLGTYFTTYQDEIDDAFFDGFGEAIELAIEKTDGTIYLSEYVNAPYIYALFYEETNPAVFLETVDYENPDSSVRFVNSFGRYITGLPEKADPYEDAAYVAHPWEAQFFNDQEFQKIQVKNYVFITPR